MSRFDVIAKSNLPLAAKWLAVYLREHMNRKGEVTATAAAISAWTGLNRRAVYDAIDALQSRRFILVIHPFRRGPNSSATLALTWPTETGVSELHSEIPVEFRNYTPKLVSGDATPATLIRGDSTPPLNNPLPSIREGAYASLSSSSLSSPVSDKDEELTQESVSEAQGELLDFAAPDWLESLRAAPGYDLDARRERSLIAWVETRGISMANCLLAATALAARWEARRKSPTNRNGYTRIDLTFRNWVVREQGKGQANDRTTNGRYRAPGLVLPKPSTSHAGTS